MPESYSLSSLDLNEVNLILRGLGEIPAKDSFLTIIKLQKQIVQQQKPSEEAPAQ